MRPTLTPHCIHPTPIHHGLIPHTNPQTKNSTCATTLVREYFALLGLFTHDDHGLALLRHSGLLALLPRLGQRLQTLHLARLALVHMDYRSPNSYGRDLLLSWLTTPTTSNPLRLFCLNLLKALLHDPRVPGMEQWGVEALLALAHAPVGGGEDAEVRE